MKNLRKYMQLSMEAMGKEKVKTEKFSFTIKSSAPKLVIDDEKSIPEQFLIPQPAQIDKKLLLKAVKDGVYDIPGKASDGTTMYDASDEVYEYLICSICPVDLAKPGLSYQTENSRFEDRTRDWVMGMPMHGFLWPSFSDRTENIHEALLYTKKTADIQEDFITNSLGTMIPQTSD